MCDAGLRIQMLRIYKYMPALICLYEMCEDLRSDYMQNLQEYIKFRSDKLKGDSKAYTEFQKHAEEINVFVKDLYKINETVVDWKGSYLHCLGLGFEDIPLNDETFFHPDLEKERRERKRKTWQFYHEQEAVKEEVKEWFQSKYPTYVYH